VVWENLLERVRSTTENAMQAINLRWFLLMLFCMKDMTENSMSAAQKFTTAMLVRAIMGEETLPSELVLT
jgi:hypothetical protein